MNASSSHQPSVLHLTQEQYSCTDHLVVLPSNRPSVSVGMSCKLPASCSAGEAAGEFWNSASPGFARHGLGTACGTEHFGLHEALQHLQCEMLEWKHADGMWQLAGWQPAEEKGKLLIKQNLNLILGRHVKCPGHIGAIRLFYTTRSLLRANYELCSQ